jgi:hypothetical protein
LFVSKLPLAFWENNESFEEERNKKKFPWHTCSLLEL